MIPDGSEDFDQCYCGAPMTQIPCTYCLNVEHEEEEMKREALEPRRVQRKRTKGWRMPKNTLYVGRGSAYGNPYPVTDSMTAEQAVEMFRQWINDKRQTNTRRLAIKELKGKNLACWCAPDQPCHADVLLEIANG